jgi:DNA-binding XRE family transcriptional regulator
MKLAQMKPSKRISLTAQRPSKTRLLVDLQGMRESKGVTIRQVEEAISVSNATLCQIEHGCTPRLDSALKIAAFVDLPVEKVWALKAEKNGRAR